MTKFELVDVKNVIKGDTILIEDKMITVGLVQNKFGNGFLNTKGMRGMVSRILFPKWHSGKIVKYVTQL